MRLLATSMWLVTIGVIGWIASGHWGFAAAAGAGVLLYAAETIRAAR